MTATAHCHCGKTQITLPETPAEATDCNCSYCVRTGALWAYYDPGEVSVEAAEDRIYSASEGVNRHHFCGVCGGNTHGSAPDYSTLYNEDGSPKDGVDPGSMPETRKIQINVRMIDGLDLEGLTITKLDGAGGW